MEAQMEKVYSAFVDAVATGRRNLTARQVRDMEADVYTGRDAVDAGLADDVGTFDGVVAEAESGRAPSRQQPQRASLAAPAPPAQRPSSSPVARAGIAPSPSADFALRTRRHQIHQEEQIPMNSPAHAAEAARAAVRAHEPEAPASQSGLAAAADRLIAKRGRPAEATGSTAHQGTATSSARGLAAAADRLIAARVSPAGNPVR
jgi:hypothetical protein